jgi:LuxR family transcriptional activator of conjugal transfer of Ti plasmids
MFARTQQRYGEGQRMDTAFQRFMAELPTRQDLAAVESLLERALALYGFRMFAYLSFTPGESVEKILALTTYPSSWVESYSSNRYDRLDPIIARSVTTTLPFTWSIRSPGSGLTRPQQRFLDEADDHGIRHGFTIPIHDRRGKTATLTVATPEERSEFEARLENHHHALHLIAIYLHAWIRRSLLSSDRALRPMLTHREIACIQWAARGKSAVDIAAILSIRPRTVVFHIENAKQKFGVPTLQQAIARAITHDIISV